MSPWHNGWAEIEIERERRREMIGRGGMEGRAARGTEEMGDSEKRKGGT